MVLKRKSDSEDEQDEPKPYEVPSSEWTPKQVENWEKYGSEIYDRLETVAGRYWYRRTWRPKKRNNGMMTRDHVKLGTPEDYVAEFVEDSFDPWGDMTSTMMRRLGPHNSNEELKDAIADIVRARLRKMWAEDKQSVVKLLADSRKVTNLYGIDTDQLESIENIAAVLETLERDRSE